MFEFLHQINLKLQKRSREAYIIFFGRKQTIINHLLYQLSQKSRCL